MLRKTREVAAVVFGVLAWVCVPFVAVAQERDPAFDRSTFWSMRASGTVEEASGEARVGALLFRQDFVASREAVLSEGVSLPGPPAAIFSPYLGDAVFAAGDALAEIVGARSGYSAYCDLDFTLRSDNVLDGRKLRYCLVDTNQDGLFDTFHFAAGQREDDFTAFMLLRPTKERISVPYEVRSTETQRLLSAGAVVTQSVLGAFRLEFAVTDRDRPVVLSDARRTTPTTTRAPRDEVSDARSVFFRAADIPVTLNLGGAQIEIQSIENGVVRYRVLSGFDESEPAFIGYSWTLPRDE